MRFCDSEAQTKANGGDDLPVQGLDFCEVERSSVHLTVAHHGTPVLLKWDVVDPNLIVCEFSRLCSPSLYP